MPADFAVYYLSQPFGLALMLALMVGPLAVLRLAFPKAFALLGWRRLLLAQGAVAAAVFLLAAWTAFSIVAGKVQAGHVSGDDFYSRVAGSSVYFFLLFHVFALLFSSFVLVPLSLWMVRAGCGSLGWFAMLGVLTALGLGGLAVVFPGNDWGRTHAWELFVSTVGSAGLAAFLVCVTFAFGAGLPISRRRQPDGH